MPSLVKCSWCNTWQEQKNDRMFPCPKCNNQIIIGLLGDGARRTGNWIVCRCRESSVQAPPGHSEVEINCTRCGSQRVSTATGAAVVTLETFGTVVMEFQQGALLKATLGEEMMSKHNVNGGICYGVCLNWVRRQLLSEKADRHIFASEMVPKAVVRGTQTHTTQRETDRSWPAIVAAVDAKRSARKPGSHNLLANLDLYSSGSDAGAAVDVTVRAVCERSDFMPGDCAVFCCYPATGAVGHSVATVKKHDAYYLFDPNYGVYSINSSDTMGRALDWVFCRDSGGLKATASTRVLNHELFRRAAPRNSSVQVAARGD